MALWDVCQLKGWRENCISQAEKYLEKSSIFFLSETRLIFTFDIIQRKHIASQSLYLEGRESWREYFIPAFVWTTVTEVKSRIQYIQCTINATKESAIIFWQRNWKRKKRVTINIYENILTSYHSNNDCIQSAFLILITLYLFELSSIISHVYLCFVFSQTSSWRLISPQNAFGWHVFITPNLFMIFFSFKIHGVSKQSFSCEYSKQWRSYGILLFILHSS